MDELLDRYRPLSQDSKDIECSCYEGAGHLPADQSDIAFCDVEFSYEDNDFILSLPLRYQTSISEKSTMLSGDQRQRLSITRAFLKTLPF